MKQYEWIGPEGQHPTLGQVFPGKVFPEERLKELGLLEMKLLREIKAEPAAIERSKS